MDDNKKAEILIVGGTSMIASASALKLIRKGVMEATGSITVYHGTSNANAKKIIKKNLGAKLPIGSFKHKAYAVEGKKYSFITTSKSQAKLYSQVANANHLINKKNPTKKERILLKKATSAGIIYEKALPKGKILKYNLPMKEFNKFRPDDLHLDSNNKFVKQGSLSSKYLSSNVTFKDMVNRFKAAPKELKISGAKKILTGKTLLITGAIMAGAAAYAYFKSTGKGKWITSNGRTFLIKG